MKRRRHRINLARNRYMSVRLGALNVAAITEVYPGDYIATRSRIGVHLSPMQAPQMGALALRQDTFFVPNRILWDFWDNYISRKLLENSAVGPFGEDKLIPPMLLLSYYSGSITPTITDLRGIYPLAEQLGIKLSKLPSAPATSPDQYGIHVNAFPLMGYWRIWHDYYRDPYLQNDVFVAAGSNPIGLRTPYQGDPWADEQPIASGATMDSTSSWDVPMSTISPLLSNLPGTFNQAAGTYPVSQYFRGIFSFAKRRAAVACCYQEGSSLFSYDGVCSLIPLIATTAPGGPNLSLLHNAPVCMPKDYIFSARQSPVYNEDISVPATVLELRKAFQILGYQEKVNRYDNRIKSWLRSFFGVNISDKRLDVPQWLGGTQSIINCSEILGTVNNTDTVLGQLGGRGIGVNSGRYARLRSEDHGYLYTMFSIVPLPVYGDGIDRFWMRGVVSPSTRAPINDGSLDWAIPDFQRIGMQSLYRYEVDTSQPGLFNSVIGYTDRYADIGFARSDVCGDFRSTLRFWHTGLFYGGPSNISTVSNDLPYFNVITGDQVSVYPRLYTNQTGQTYRNTIETHLSRLFDAGYQADQYWCIISTDTYKSSKIGVHSNPGHADHTTQPA